METKLHDYSEILGLPNRSVIKDSRNRLFQIRQFESGERLFAMFGDSGYYHMDDSNSKTIGEFAFPVTVLWYGQEVRLEGGYDDPHWIQQEEPC
jgi:hypothetical protein